MTIRVEFEDDPSPNQSRKGKNKNNKCHWRLIVDGTVVKSGTSFDREWAKRESNKARKKYLADNDL